METHYKKIYYERRIEDKHTNFTLHSSHSLETLQSTTLYSHSKENNEKFVKTIENCNKTDSPVL